MDPGERPAWRDENSTRSSRNQIYKLVVFIFKFLRLEWDVLSRSFDSDEMKLYALHFAV